jgi:hypothetical protein
VAKDYMRNERERWSYMDYRQLVNRLEKISTLDKLECFISMADTVARRVNHTQVMVNPTNAQRLMELAAQRAYALGFNSLGITAGNYLNYLRDNRQARTQANLASRSGLTSNQLQTARISALEADIQSFDRNGINNLLRTRRGPTGWGTTLSEAELLILLNYFGLVLNHQFDGVFMISKADALQFCQQLANTSFSDGMDGIASMAREVINNSTLNQPKPERSTVRVVRFRKKEE